ncbi:MAG: hypothetical protein ABIQ07_01410 [Ginsengibacter sp.]
MIEVFKTNVGEVYAAQKIMASLVEHFPESKINFDLHDCDKILRFEGEIILASKVISIVKENGFTCSVLD